MLNEGEKHNVSNPSLDISIYDPNDKQLVEFIAGNNFDNKINTNAEVGEFWDSDEEVAFKKAEAKRQKALEKKLKETAPKRTRKTTKKAAKAIGADNEV